MARGRTIITGSFLDRIRRTGALAEAAERMGTLAGPYEPLPGMSTWGLVCEEIVDTEHDPKHYERVVAELIRRGISMLELEEMRVFAWETAGWFNFEKMVWDWCDLDEGDIRKAIQWQVEEGEIDIAEANKRLGYLERYTTGRHAGNTRPT